MDRIFYGARACYSDEEQGPFHAGSIPGGSDILSELWKHFIPVYSIGKNNFYSANIEIFIISYREVG